MIFHSKDKNAQLAFSRRMKPLAGKSHRRRVYRHILPVRSRSLQRPHWLGYLPPTPNASHICALRPALPRNFQFLQLQWLLYPSRSRERAETRQRTFRCDCAWGGCSTGWTVVAKPRLEGMHQFWYPRTILCFHDAQRLSGIVTCRRESTPHPTRKFKIGNLLPKTGVDVSALSKLRSTIHVPVVTITFWNT